MYSFIQKILFLLPAEQAHHFTTYTLKLLLSFPPFRWIFQKSFTLRHPGLRREVFGLTFSNPVGLAAGFDKNAELIREMAAMGFGFIEIGTVTPLPQEGNPKPRLFRLKKDQALINRMGFNNKGMQVVKANLLHRPKGVIVGGNIGKNKATPNEQAESDYLKCFETLFPYVDYFVINVSSPNTPDLRKLQEKEPLQKLIQAVQEANNLKGKRKPLLLKIAPDLTDEQLDDILDIARLTKLDGLIATNTTIDRYNLKENKDKVDRIGAGGLSGKPLFDRSTEVVRYLRAKNRELPIIAAGGIMSGKDALRKLAAGANLVQIYSGLIYEGPGVVKAINEEILNKLDEA